MFIRGSGEIQEVGGGERTSQKQQRKRRKERNSCKQGLHTIIPRDENEWEKNKMYHGGICNKMGIGPMNIEVRH